MFSADKADGTESHNQIGFSPYRKKVGGDDYLPTDSPSAKKNLAKKTSFMDSQRGIQLHDNLMGHYIRELDRQAENRLDMAMDEDFYDHIQFTPEDLKILEARGQAPLVFNMIHTSVNWVLGSQRRSAMDFRILSRTKEGVTAAERKTQLIKHVDDCNHFTEATSEAFASAVKAGLGWFETGQGGEEDTSKVMARSESWRSMLYDSTAIRYDLEDARYQMRVKWLDVDLAMGLWSHRRGFIQDAANQSGNGMFMTDNLGDEVMDYQETEHFQSYGGSGRNTSLSSRDRVRVIECWFKRMVPDAVTMMGGQFHGELFDPWSQGHVNDVNNELSQLSKRARQVMHCAIMTDGGLLDVRRSPYRHGRYPFTPVWGYRRARDNMPYGLVRGLRDIQRDLNRRAAKALHHLSTTRVTVQEGAVDDIDELRDEAARPDAVIVYKKTHAAPHVEADKDIAAAHVDMMSRDQQMIQQVSGVTDENLGRSTNAKSGKAILARQDQGALTTSLFFDNLRTSRALHGEKSLINVEQYYTEEDQFRVTDSRGNPDYVSINNGEDENSIAIFKADFIISEEDWRATAKQAQAEQLLELANRLSSTAPQMVVGIMDLVVEALDVPKQDELVRRIRAVTGQEDPDADPNNPTPEEAQRQQAKQAQQAMQQRAAEAEITQAEAEARKTMAEAAKIEAEAGGQGDDRGQQAQAEIDQKASELQEAFASELMSIREDALKQTAMYEQKLAQAQEHASAAFRAVELEKERIKAESVTDKAAIDKEAKIAVAQINAVLKKTVEEANAKHDAAMRKAETQGEDA